MRCLALALIAVVLSACSHAPLHRGQVLVFTGLAGEPETLNPLVASAADLFNFSHLYMSGLVEADDRGRLVPEIAERVPTIQNGGISRDGRTIVYHLRRNLRWQDGTPLTASDVVFSFHAVMNPENNVLTRVGYSEVEFVRARDPHTVVVRLRRAFSPIVSYFFGPQGAVMLMPEHLLAKYPNLNRVPYNQQPIGSGPFRVVKWWHGDEIVLEANPLYWRGKPAIERMIYRIVPDPNTRMEQLQTGEVDAYFDVDPELLPQIRSLRAVHVVYTPVNDIHVLEYNVADPLLRDVRVRRAIALAIDRRKLIEAATHGAGLAMEGDQPRNGWAYDAELPQVPDDPGEARRLLDAAGWHLEGDNVRSKDGQPLELTLAIAPQGINGSALVATVIQRDLAEAGIRTVIKQYPPGLMWEPKPAGGILANGHYQLAYNAWWTLGPDPDDTWNFACDQIPPGGENFYFWCNRGADVAMHDALATFDERRRRAEYAIVQRALVNDLPELALWQVNMPDALRRPIQNFAPSTAGSTFWNAWAWKL